MESHGIIYQASDLIDPELGIFAPEDVSESQVGDTYSIQVTPAVSEFDLDLANFFSRLAKFLLLTAFAIIVVLYLPSALSWVRAGSVSTVSKIIAQTAKEPASIPIKTNSPYQPKFDPTLVKESNIKIASIGVDTPIWEATYEGYEEALKKGVWRAPDFGTPFDREKPTILAAHRYGYLVWTNIFRRKNSFYNLGKLKVGDTIEITYRQRKYIYEVYMEDKGEKISDYSAELILYTCESLRSPVRIFKYARLIEV